MRYLGSLPTGDQLYGFLKYEVFPQIGVYDDDGFRVFRLNGSNAVYLYEERRSGARVIGKFFLSDRERDPGRAERGMEREYHNLARFREYGFTGGLHYVARPLGRNRDLNCFLAVEYCVGEPLDRIIARTAASGDRRTLLEKLTALAYFLAALHNRSAQTECRVDTRPVREYAGEVIGELERDGLFNPGERDYLTRQCADWCARRAMNADCQVMVHGDATPSNFLFGDGLHVITFDLERGHRADRVFDVGRIAGELAHHFAMSGRGKAAAEPFIGHFLWEYACHFPDRERTFQAVAARVPFYMGLTLLRIARNDWLEWNYRKNLVYEADKCLDAADNWRF